jgi:hypothetical protein
VNTTSLRVVDDYLSPVQCAELLAAIEAYRVDHDPPLIERAVRGRSLRYRVIDGHEVANRLTALEPLYTRTAQVLGAWLGCPVHPIDDRVAGINVNITPPGGEYRWHYDRNEVTAIVYLNEVGGGDTEVYVDHRVVMPRPLQVLQPQVDAIARSRMVLATVGSKSVVEPRAGRMVAMRGDRCLHSVCPVTGTHDRINVCMAYDRVGHESRSRRALDTYLYTSESIGSRDPNYRR